MEIHNPNYFSIIYIYIYICTYIYILICLYTLCINYSIINTTPDTIKVDHGYYSNAMTHFIGYRYVYI